MKEKNTRKKGIDLVRKELERRKFNVTRTPKRNSPGDLTVATEFTEKTVKIRACQDNEGGNGYSIDNNRERALEKAREVDFYVFVKLNGDKIVESFVWHRDDEDLIHNQGKWGLFPYRKKSETKDKWQKRKDEFGWKLIESLMAAGEMNSSPQSKMDAKDKKLRKMDSDRAAPVVDTDFRRIDKSKMSPRNFTAGFARNFSMDNTQKAEEMHQEIACDLCNALRERKLHPLFTQSIDVAAYEGKLVFEIKSANEKNFENQARGGIIQILEYKWQCESQKKISPQPVLVIASISSAKREAYMKKFAESVGVSVVWYHCGRPLPERFDGLDELLD